MAGSGIMSGKRSRKPHLVEGPGGLAAEVNDLRRDVESALGPLTALVVEEYTNPSAADTDSIKLAVASVAAATVYSGAALDGVVGAGALSPTRRISITTAGATPADAPATALITGIDVKDRPLTETIVVSQIAATADGSKFFKKVTSITLPAADGVGATLAFGHASTLPLPVAPRARAGLLALVREIEVGVVVTTGTIYTGATFPPFGGYEPATAPDGVRDYAVYYDGDPSIT